MDNITLTLILCLAVFCGACLVMLGIFVGTRFGRLLTWALAYTLIIWGVVVAGVSTYHLIMLWT